MKTISAIPIFRMDNYVGEMRLRLAEKQIGAKRQFLRELLNEVRVRGSNITPTFKLPLAASERRCFYTTKVGGPTLDSNPFGVKSPAVTNGRTLFQYFPRGNFVNLLDPKRTPIPSQKTPAKVKRLHFSR